MPLVSRTRAILRSAEFGFLGVVVLTCGADPPPLRAGLEGGRLRLVTNRFAPLTNELADRRHQASSVPLPRRRDDFSARSGLCLSEFFDVGSLSRRARRASSEGRNRQRLRASPRPVNPVGCRVQAEGSGGARRSGPRQFHASEATCLPARRGSGDPAVRFLNPRERSDLPSRAEGLGGPAVRVPSSPRERSELPSRAEGVRGTRRSGSPGIFQTSSSRSAATTGGSSS